MRKHSRKLLSASVVGKQCTDNLVVLPEQMNPMNNSNCFRQRFLLCSAFPKMPEKALQLFF